jgi:hypothetical protein
LAGDVGGGPTLLLDAGTSARPVLVPLSFARLRELVVAEVSSIEKGPVTGKQRKRRKATLERLRAMAQAPMWTMPKPPRSVYKRLLQRRLAYVLAAAEGLVPRATDFLAVTARSA